MSAVLMNILAYLAILSLIGLVGVIVWMIITVQSLIKTGKSAVAMTVPPRQAVERIANVGKGIGLKTSARATTIFGHGKSMVNNVVNVKDDVTAAVSSIDIDELKSTLSNTAEVVGAGGGDQAKLLKRVVETFVRATAVHRN